MTRTMVAMSLAATLLITHLPVDLPAEEEIEVGLDDPTRDFGSSDDSGLLALARDELDLADLEEDSPPPPPLVERAWTGRARVTAYSRGCGDSGRTATGTVPSYGTVAVDPRVIRLHSALEIEGLDGTFHALDTGGGVRGQHLDLWLPTCASARLWGSQYRAYRVLS